MLYYTDVLLHRCKNYIDLIYIDVRPHQYRKIPSNWKCNPIGSSESAQREITKITAKRIVH